MRVVLVVAVVSALVVPVAPAAAQDPEGRYQQFGDRGGFFNVMPPGQKGRLNAAEASAAQGGEFPAHFNDQTAMYDDLPLQAGLPTQRLDYLGVSDGDLYTYFKDASFGARSVASRYSPTAGLVIVRDGEFGVPHIFGETRHAAMFGAGYAGAEDRMFLMDVLRHLGRARLSELLGASPANLEMDRDQLRVAPYQEHELVAQAAAICAAGAEGRQVCDDLESYTQGVNLFFAEARQDPSKLPAEYPALQIVPRDWVPADTVAIASLVGGIFGRGGGGEVANSRFLSQLVAHHGEVTGRRIFEDFRSANDPEAPVTTTRLFPYNNHANIDPASTAMLDLDSVDATIAEMTAPPLVADGPLGPIPLHGGLGTSNAILAGASLTDGGKPIAVFGPQTGYFTPQLLVEMDIHGPGIDARGVAFAGTNIYVQLGRGRDYAWSATSAGADNVDQWVVELCEPGGEQPTRDSNHYLHHGVCIPMDVYTHRQIAKPTAGGFPPALDQNPIIIDDEVRRTVYGPVVATGTVGGAPVAVTVQRSTYGAELVSAFGFRRVNDPAYMARGAAAFLDAFDGVDYTFNWFYVDERDIAYKHSCLCPIRHPRTDPDLPTWGTGQWDWTGRWLAPGAQPHEINPPSGYLVNWNNKQAPLFRASDSNYDYSSTYRSQHLEARLAGAVAAGRRLTRADMVNIAIDAATVDLNGQEIYPLALRVLGEAAPGGDAVLQAMRDRLADWVAAGGHRRDLEGETIGSPPDGRYDHAVAVSIGDALVRPLLAAVFGDELAGADLPQRVEDHPRQGVGSSYNGGQMNFVHKDLRQVLGDPVVGRRSRTYCGGGNLAACRAALWAAMGQARDALVAEYGSGNPDTWVYDQRADRIEQSAVGLAGAPSMRWQNRPTFHQVAQPGSRVGRVSGSDRIRTALALSRQAFPGGADTVVIASAGTFADAVAGAPLAIGRNAPMLLSSRGGLSAAVQREVRRLGAQTAYVLGGTAALAPQVDEDLRAAGITDVRRLAGSNRFDTARLVALEMGAAGGSVVIASGEDFPDALAAGPYAGVTGRPILLTGRHRMQGETVAGLGGVTEAIVAGGRAAVGDGVTAELASRNIRVQRISGATRYDTAAAFAEAALDQGLSASDVFVATGTRFPDALATGPAAAQIGGVLVLVAPDRLADSPPAERFLRSRAARIDRLWMAGGTAALASELRAQIEAAIAR